MKNFKLPGSSRHELRAVLLTSFLITAGVMLPPYLTRLSPQHESISVQFIPAFDSISNGSSLASKDLRDTIDINTADSATWESLPGIGPVLSARIIKFRNALGGFASVDQIGQTYGLEPETFQRIKPDLVYKTEHSMLDPAQSSTWDLTRHPYIDKQQAAMLKDLYRDSIPSRAALTKIGPAEWIRKVSPYLVSD